MTPGQLTIALAAVAGLAAVVTIGMLEAIWHGYGVLAACLILAGSLIRLAQRWNR